MKSHSPPKKQSSSEGETQIELSPEDMLAPSAQVAAAAPFKIAEEEETERVTCRIC